MSDYIPPVPSLLASASPATRGTARRMKIYFQPSPNPNDPNIVGANENDPPVAPAIDSDIDIAISNKKRYIQYAVDRSTNATANNPTPLSPEVGTTAQQTYINQDPELNYSGIPNAFNVFNDSPTMFDNQTLTRDAGVAQVDIINTEVGTIKGRYAGNVGRPFAIRKYVGQLNALETSDPDSDAQKNAHHNRLVDAQLLSFRGANSQNKHVPPAGEDPETRDNSIPLGNMFYQGGLGKFAVGTYVRQDTSKATELTVEQLKQVGLNIVFNAVGGNDIDVNVRTPGDAALAELALAAPIGPRIGQKVKLSRFSAAREAQKLFGATKSSSTTFIDTDDDVDSYGSFNNPFSQFDALVSVGQTIVTATMVVAFVVSLDSLTGIIKGARGASIETSGPLSDPLVNAGHNNLVKGSSTILRTPENPNEVYPAQVSSNLGSFLSDWANLDQIFTKPNHRFEDCIYAGIEEFFGFNVGFSSNIAGQGGSIANSSMKILTESGRLSVILRELFRNSFSDMASKAAAAFTGTGVGSPVSGIFEFLKSITESKIVKFINVLIGIGDRTLTADETLGAEPSPGTRQVGQYSVDLLADEPKNYIKKSRLSDGSLAWSTTTAPYYSLTLATLASPLLSRLESELNLTPWPLPNSTNSTNQYGSALEGRISAKEVKDIEDSLESDYMPFYFHDLRTNEIMSFHAFLENASEDFSVEYTSQEGYGRMDKVQIYKGTTRNITVDFKMIATSAESHDDMWYKINRLAMMIYPQWTQGRKLDVGNLKFIQPFSQIPGATPVIRLRLGDLYKSNYSKMAVARLFGATTRRDYNVTGSITATPATTPAPAATAATAATATTPVTPTNDPRYVKWSQITNGGRFTSGQDSTVARRGHNPRVLVNPNSIFVPGATIILDGSNPHLRRRINGHYYTNSQLNFSARGARLIRSSAGEASEAVTRPIERAFPGGRVRANYVGLGPRNSIKVRIVGYDEKFTPNIGFSGPDLQQPAPQERQVTLQKTSSDGIETINLEEFRSLINFNETGRELLRFIIEQQNAANRTVEDTQPTSVDPNAMTPRDFYDDAKNPILKAFNSTAGKGLAGVITSFKVDYKESDKRWGTDVGTTLRAPMYVTISVTMAVIHDIPLGLDANGIMNAPIWPVGPSSNYFMRGEQTPGSSTVVSSPQAVDSEVAGAPRGLG